MFARMSALVQNRQFDLTMRWRDWHRDDRSSCAPAKLCMHVKDRQLPCVAGSKQDQGLGCGDGFLTAYKPRKPFVPRRLRMRNLRRLDQGPQGRVERPVFTLCGSGTEEEVPRLRSGRRGDYGAHASRRIAGRLSSACGWGGSGGNSSACTGSRALARRSRGMAFDAGGPAF
jgi:hypothetical protein